MSKVATSTEMKPRCPLCGGVMELVVDCLGNPYWLCDACWEWIEREGNGD